MIERLFLFNYLFNKVKFLESKLYIILFKFQKLCGFGRNHKYSK